MDHIKYCVRIAHALHQHHLVAQLISSSAFCFRGTVVPAPSARLWMCGPSDRGSKYIYCTYLQYTK
jgi:hypothetical protein